VEDSERPAARQGRLKSPEAIADAMPYFIYKITPPLTLTYVDTKEKFAEARTLVRTLRQGDGGDGTEHRMIFAKSRAEAEKLLSTPRDERVIGED
jgi:hypothetical protein